MSLVTNYCHTTVRDARYAADAMPGGSTIDNVGSPWRWMQNRVKGKTGDDAHWRIAVLQAARSLGCCWCKPVPEDGTLISSFAPRTPRVLLKRTTMLVGPRFHIHVKKIFPFVGRYISLSSHWPCDGLEPIMNRKRSSEIHCAGEGERFDRYSVLVQWSPHT